MKPSKSKIEKLISKISKENLKLLKPNERKSEYHLQKLLAWQNEFDEEDWQNFKDNWTYCSHCKSFTEDFCICYTR